MQPDPQHPCDIWVNESFDAGEDIVRPARTLALLALEEGEVLRRWTVRDAWIAEVGYSDFDSKSDDLLEETLTIHYKDIEPDPLASQGEGAPGGLGLSPERLMLDTGLCWNRPRFQSEGVSAKRRGFMLAAAKPSVQSGDLHGSLVYPRNVRSGGGQGVSVYPWSGLCWNRFIPRAFEAEWAKASVRGKGEATGIYAGGGQAVSTKAETCMGRWPGKTVIGLTGNIAVGKSQVLGQLESLGAGVIDADRVAREVLEPGGAALAAVVAEFGEALLDGQGRLDRAALGRVVFSDAAALARLEALTHPVIRRRIDELVRSAPQPVLVIEAIKLLEGDLAEAVDAVWVVDAAPETQLARLTGQRGMSPADARQRLQAQNPQADKLARADLVIRNDGSLAALQEEGAGGLEIAGGRAQWACSLTCRSRPSGSRSSSERPKGSCRMPRAGAMPCASRRSTSASSGPSLTSASATRSVSCSGWQGVQHVQAQRGVAGLQRRPHAVTLQIVRLQAQRQVEIQRAGHLPHVNDWHQFQHLVSPVIIRHPPQCSTPAPGVARP